MTLEDLTSEAADLLRSLINNPHAVPDGPALQELVAARLAMGSPNKTHATGAAVRLLQPQLVGER